MVEEDDEQIQVDLSKIPENVSKVAFTVTIYDAEPRRQNFGQVSNAYIRIVDETTGTELIRYDLGEDFSVVADVMAFFYFFKYICDRKCHKFYCRID